MDTFEPAERSEIMRCVRSSGTRPERIVRAMVRRMGIRYRAWIPYLPGKKQPQVPTLALPVRATNRK